ncbi:hypothetical protein [Photorhabdus heterorhabditis]
MPKSEMCWLWAYIEGKPSVTKSVGVSEIWINPQWISRCIATAREQIPGSIDNDVTGVSERSQQSSSLKDEGYR